MAHTIASWEFHPCAEHADLTDARDGVEEFFNSYLTAESCADCTTTVTGSVIAPETAVLRKPLNP